MGHVQSCKMVKIQIEIPIKVSRKLALMANLSDVNKAIKAAELLSYVINKSIPDSTFDTEKKEGDK